jgi:radical SAM superfamily enzyme YgiQ (UPF0313 family)
LGDKGRVLLVNPWIYDFAAYNLWIEPVGLLTIAAALRDNGYRVAVVDCLIPQPGSARVRLDGTGKLPKTEVDKPAAVASIPRRYGRYGLSLEQFDTALAGLAVPDLVLVTSGMTYWYPGVVEAIRRVRLRFGRVPVALGGVYATLCAEHARQHSGADQVIVGPGVMASLRLADEVTGSDSTPGRYTDPRTWPSPAHELVPRRFAALITSWGCPFVCTYCASHRLQPAFVQREPRAVVDDMAACARRGSRDLAFYDDALLINARHHMVPILEAVIDSGLGVRLHTPNGLHAREITADLAVLMRRAGVVSVRLSFETADATRQRETGGKVTTDVFAQAVAHLHAAGFGPSELAAYLLAGLPNQPLSEVENTIHLVHRLGVQAKISLFSPIPGTPDGDRALPANADPLLHNKTVYPYLRGPDYVEQLQRLKELANEGNATLVAG